MTKPSAALEELTLELERRARHDLPPPPCSGDQRFTSDEPEHRTEVIDLCRPCPLRRLCAAASKRMTHGVWAGIDRSTPSVTKTSRTTTNRKAA